ncbi:MAG: hypothetical protein ACO2PO_16500 [Candidatus Calescibacterium sp.]
MGEEQLQQQEPVQQEPAQEGSVQEEALLEVQQQADEGPVVKVLRQKLEQEIKTRKKLEEELAKTREFLNVSDVGELMKKIERLELENLVAKKYPELSEEIEEIMRFKREGESIEDAILRYIGKKSVENRQSQVGFSLGSSKLSSPPSEPQGKISKEQAEQLFKQLYYPEE